MFNNSIAVADVNGDGRPDMVVGSHNGVNLDGSVNVLLGNGDGTFQRAVAYDSGAHSARSVAIADLNRDGRLDVIVANCGFGTCFGRGSVGILLGNGDGTLKSIVSYDSGGYNAFSVALADVNRDNLIDIVVVNACAELSSCDCSVAVLLANENGTFATPLLYLLKGQETATFGTVVDVNSDGQPDIVVAGLDSGISILLGNGDGSFQFPVIYDAGGYPDMSVAVGDVNGDEIPDLVAAKRLGGNPINGLVDVLLGNGDGTFQSALSYLSGGFDAWSVAIADFNGDGGPDIVAANLYTCIGPSNNCPSGKLGVLLNNTPFCPIPPVITVSTAPTALWPPTGNMVPVTVSGTITATGCPVSAATYAVIDEYGKVQPSGPVTLHYGGAYNFTVWLQASRFGTDSDGRVYSVTVSASNNAGKMGSKLVKVIVPHDRGH
jgi:hypothetical protein